MPTTPQPSGETLHALRVRYPGRRLWALFEPRSNTTRRAVFQNDLPGALALADNVVLTQVARAGQLKQGEGLDVPQVVAETRNQGAQAWYVPEIGDIVSLMQKEVKAGDVIAVLSNGSFGGLIEKLLTEL